MASNIYEALPQQPGSNYIRVCELQPGTGDEPIQMELRPLRIGLPCSQEYKAISWVWGSSSNSTKLSYRGQDITVRQNLVDALRVFRCPDRPRTLWADAICINQEDHDERSSQVAIMGEIFSHAMEVLIWLGDDPEQQSAIFFDEIRRLYLRPSVNSSKLSSITCLNSWDAHLWQSIKSFYTNPWFRRVWIQQEVGLAKIATFYWGMSTISSEMVSSFHWTTINDRYTDDRIRTLLRDSVNVESTIRMRNWNYRGSMASDLNFPELLYVYRISVATDPRDYVYGALSHSSAKKLGSCTDLLVTPDYRKTVESVYLDTMKAMLFDPRSSELQPLLLVHHTASTLMAGVPSWVAWLHHPLEASLEQDCDVKRPLLWERWQIPAPNVLLDFRNTHLAAGGYLKVQFDIKGHHLNVSGTILDRLESTWTDPMAKLLDLWVSYIHISNKISTVPRKSMDHLSNALPTVTSWLEKTPYEDTILAAALAVSRGYIYLNSELHMAVGHLNTFRNSFLDYFAQNTGLTTDAYLPTNDSPPPNIWSFEQFAKLNHVGRAFGRSEMGYFGLIPQIAVKGDCIAVFSGVAIPYILRPISDGVYKLVGHCYIQGIMDGEAISAMQDREESPINFVII